MNEGKVIDRIHRLIIENNKDLICVLDKDGYFVYANPAFERFLGTSLQELTGSNFLLIIHPNDRDSVVKMFEEIFIKNETVSPEIRYRNSRGEWVTYEAAGNCIRNNEDNTIEFVISSRELTERHKWEEEIVKAKEKAEEAAEFKSWFLSAMSHEIRTPLNVIFGYTSLLKEIYCHDPSDEERDIFKNVDKAVRRLLNTISQILDLSRIETGEFPVKFEKLNLVILVKSISELLQNLAEEKNLKLVFNSPGYSIYGWVDEYCASAIITNLISNSIKYSEKGIINIKITTDNDFVKIIVADEGIGMSKEYQAHLFEIFKREDEISGKRYEGSGFGLALTKKFVELLNGSIEIESIKDVGTKVIVSIPLISEFENSKKPVS